MKILQATSKYSVLDVPQKRNPQNLLVKYTITYSRSPSSNVPKTNHTECVYYEVTWCGDGVLDTKYGEQCDPNDPSKTGW